MFCKVCFIGLCSVAAVASLAMLTNCSKNNNLKNFNYTFDDNNFTEIDMKISYGELKILPSTDNKVSIDVKNVPETFKYEMNDGVLVVDFGKKSSLVGIHTKKTSVVIEIPEKNYEKLDLQLGAGLTTIEDLSISNINIACGSGKLEMNHIKADNLLYIKGGVGQINVFDNTVGGLTADLGIGEFNFNGTLNGDINVNNGIGNVDINLTNPESDFKGRDSKYKLNINKVVSNCDVSYDK